MGLGYPKRTKFVVRFKEDRKGPNLVLAMGQAAWAFTSCRLGLYGP